MTDTRTAPEPLAGPRDITGNPESTFVRCPDCNGAVYNIGNQRRAHLRWHDDLDADVASAQEAAQGAQEAAHAAETSLREARAEIAALLAQIGADGPTPAVPLIGEYPDEEIADRIVDARITTDSDPTEETGHEGEPDEDGTDEDLIDVTGLIVDEDDDLDAVDHPAAARRF